jgi:hypothetical protein
MHINQELKQAIFGNLDDKACQAISQMPGVPPNELSAWLLKQAGEAVGPFLQLGISIEVLTFWFGLIMGQRLKRKEERDDDADEQQTQD